MALKSYQKSIITVIVSVVLGLGAVIGVWIGIYFAMSSFAYDRDYHINVKKIAKEEYGCDRIIWFFPCENDSAVLPDGVNIQSNEVYCVAAEKDGEEVILFIPSNPKKEKGFFAQWKFDCTFTEIVEKMESVGIVMADFHDSDGVYDKMMLADNPIYIDEENNSDKFDFPVYFQYECCRNGMVDLIYLVAQVNHEIKIYELDYAAETTSILC